MRVHVEADADAHGVEVPRRFRLRGRDIKVVDAIDRWHGADYRYFKLKGDDGNLYILRFDHQRGAWELTMFQSPRAQSVSR